MGQFDNTLKWFKGAFSVLRQFLAKTFKNDKNTFISP